jgi:hypothetical protein
VLFVAVLAVSVPGVARADEQLRGAQVHSLWSSSPVADSEREIDMLADAGANAVRIDVSWSSLETDGKGQWSPWYVDKADHIFQRANERGLKVVAVLWSTPCWASAAPDSLRQGCDGAWWDREVDRYAPRDMNDFADAAQFVADRWGSRLAALEIWNEPNLSDQYSLRAADPASTAADLQKAAYPRIKAVAPALPVLAGVLSGSDGEFLEKLYRDGIGGNFDGVSIHPYNEWRDPDDAWQEQWKQWSFLRGIPWIHQIMQNHGDGGKGVWLTEFGFSTCGQGDRWCVNQQQQAEYIKDSFRIARRWDYVKAALVYNLRNKGSNPSGREDQFGMLNRDFSPKPAWGAFREAMAAAGGPPEEAGEGDGVAPEASTSIHPPQVVAPGPVQVTSRGVAPVPVACPATATQACAGTITVETKPVRQGKGKKKRRLRLGSRRVRIKPGGVKVIQIRIPKRHRPLLKRLRTVRVSVTVSSYSQVSTSRVQTRKSGLTLRTHRIVAR